VGNYNGADTDCRPASTILVIGDIMLDQYTIGKASRLCPETPAPVLISNETSCYLGGAANVAVNIKNIGGQVTLAGVVGKDEEGDLLRKMLKQKDIPGVLGVDASRPTTVKQRVGTKEQLVVRLDREQTRDISSGIFHDILRLVTVLMEDVRIVAVSDYGKGVVTAELMAAICEICSARKIPVYVDPKGTNFAKYRGVDVIKPNFAAMEAFYGKEIQSCRDMEKAAENIISATGCSSCIMTWESNGAILFRRNGEWIHYPCSSRWNTPYMSGAGDIFMAGLVVGVSMDLPLETACKAATELASSAVGSAGTMAVCAEDWNRLMEMYNPGEQAYE
jgi:D-beta-D-heptose 7-phosphate kinase/D-beta-D-heptose 1-phosphate adenosyltransferase